MSRQPNYLIQPINAVYTERVKYDNYPPCQREKVWGAPIKQKLVDSILRGLHVPAIVVLRVTTIFGLRYEIVDGQQRFSAILDFIENGFKTMRHSDEPGMAPVEPDRSFSQLSPEKQSLFLDYPLQMCVLEGDDHNIDTVGLMYRRLQYQLKLTGAEKLFSYSSATREAAIVLARHPVWTDLYDGRTDRKQPFQMGVSIILLEAQGGFANLTTPRLRDTASGLKDVNLLDNDFGATIQRRLDGMGKIFAGASLSSINEVIPMYQAAMFLEDAGYDLQRSEQGCAAAWFMDFKQRSLEIRRSNGFKDGFTMLTKVGMQAKFWAEERDALFSCSGLFLRDSRRLFGRLDKVTAWNRQKGLCSICGKPVRIQDIGHHVQLYSVGGLTTPENCELVHEPCHTELHKAVLN